MTVVEEAKLEEIFEGKISKEFVSLYSLPLTSAVGRSITLKIECYDVKREPVFLSFHVGG